MLVAVHFAAVYRALCHFTPLYAKLDANDKFNQADPLQNDRYGHGQGASVTGGLGDHKNSREAGGCEPQAADQNRLPRNHMPELHLCPQSTGLVHVQPEGWGRPTKKAVH
jgi:hypothetical protein